MKKFDAIIIGSGQAGTPLVFDLASRGKKVAFIEKTKVGGTCLNVGCTPTKTYVASARRMWDIAHSNDLGVDFNGEFKANMKKIKQRKDDLIKTSTDGIESALKSHKNIDFIEGAAHFISDYIVEVNGDKITAPQIFINVGGRPFIPKEYDTVPYLTNRNILDLTELPEHLIIVGGSYIGLEFGQMFKRFGAKVTIIERGDAIIAREDKDVSQSITEFFKEEDINIVFNAQQIELKKLNDGVVATINGTEEIKGSHVLLAIGRTPNSDQLKLENTSIKTNERGFITVDDYCKTNVDGIFALGDCNGEGAFTHTAYNDFQIVKNYLFEDQTRKIASRISTYGLFVDPPLGRCGMNKKEALAKGINLLEGKREMSRISRAKEKGEKNGFMSVLVDADTEKIVGACVLGVGGDEIITSILNVMYADQSYKMIRDAIVALIPTTLEKLKPVV